MHRIVITAFATVGVFCLVAMSSATIARGAVQSASTDGEATVYLTGKFTSTFDIAYRARLNPGAQNKSWSTLSILLVGSKIPGPGVSVGLSSDPKHRAPQPFTYVIFPGQQYVYQNQAVKCSDGCIIELRGDRARISAYVDGALVGSWSRSDLYLQHPSIQLNGEAHGGGDSLSATLIPIRTIANGHTLHPTCAFTTRGIEPAGRSSLLFSGRTSDAAGFFVNLETGNHGKKC